MNQEQQPLKNSTRYFIYATIILLIFSFISLFLPFVEIYQPSYSRTALGVTTYEDWYTQLAPPLLFILPILTTFIPYFCSIISLLASPRKASKNNFKKLKNNTLRKPIRFFWLKFASITYILEMWMFYSIMKGDIDYLEKHGAYCKITPFGIVAILCTALLVILLFLLTKKTKSMISASKAEQQVSTIV